MNNFYWELINLFTSLFETLVILMYLADFLDTKQKPLSNLFQHILLLSGILLTNTYVKMPILTLISIMSVIFVLTFFYNGNLNIKIFAVLLIMFFSIASEMISLLSIMAFNRIDSFQALSDSNFKLLGILISKVILLILTRAVCLYRKRISYVNINIIYWVAIFIIPAVSTLTLYFIFVFNGMLGSYKFSPLSAITAIGILYINIVVFNLFRSITDKASVELKNNLLQQQIQYQLINSRENEIALKQTKAFRHDMKNHFFLIKKMIEANQLPQAIEYISNISNLSFNTNNEIYTGNLSIDSILNAKFSVAKMLNINVEKTIQIPGDLNLDPVDSCILFGNILDNAIEACSRIKTGVREINFFLSYSKECLICKVSNSTDNNLHKFGQTYLSSKKAYKHPGIGLENISNTIKKYNGTFVVDNEDTMFKLSFIIYNL